MLPPIFKDDALPANFDLKLLEGNRSNMVIFVTNSPCLQKFNEAGTEIKHLIISFN